MRLVILYSIQVLKMNFTFLGYTISLWEIIMYTILAFLVSGVIFRILE